MSRRSFRPFLAGQAALVVAILLVLALTPPSRGAILLLVPTGNAGAAISLALGHGARLLGPGPLPGSVVVIGERAVLAPAARAAGMIMLAAPFAGCGVAPERQA